MKDRQPKTSRFSFSAFERRAVWFLIILLLAAACYRIYHRQVRRYRMDLQIESSSPYNTVEEHESKAIPTLPTEDNPLDLNQAGRAELELLPGIGPVKAGNIISYRDKHGPFRSIDELDDVPGIGEKTIQKIGPLIDIRSDEPLQNRNRVRRLSER